MAFSVGSFADNLNNESEKEFYQKIAEIVYEFQTYDNVDDIKILKKIASEIEACGIKPQADSITRSKNK